MELVNIGVANLVVSNMLKESLFDDSLLTEAKIVTSKFFETVKSSPILQLEFKVLSNLENKHIDNDTLAIKYIEDNIKLFEVYTIDEIDAERAKMRTFIMENVVGELNQADYDLDKIDLYVAVDTLITESLKVSDEVDVDSIHESFNVVLNHIKEPKEEEQPNVPEIINEQIVEIAINKFNEKYESMNEEDMKLFKQLVNATDSEKEELFEEFKKENVAILEALNEENSSDKIAKSLAKINEMEFKLENADGDIVKLHELKKGLL